jgi:hypothetical protein
MQEVSIMTIIWEVLVWPITPYLCPKLAASSDWLCGVGDALGWLDQLLLELALLLPGVWPAPPGCLPCTSWMLGLLILNSAWSCYETMFTMVMSWGWLCDRISWVTLNVLGVLWWTEVCVCVVLVVLCSNQNQWCAHLLFILSSLPGGVDNTQAVHAWVSCVLTCCHSRDLDLLGCEKVWDRHDLVMYITSSYFYF